MINNVGNFLIKEGAFQRIIKSSKIRKYNVFSNISFQ